MQLHYYGHAAIRVAAANGTSVLIDPYKPSSMILYDATFDPADVVAVSHEHSDHNNVEAVPGSPTVVRGPGTHTAHGLTFHLISSFHDRASGAQRGPNTPIVFEVDGLRVAHLGDQGADLTDEDYRQLGPVNVLIAPIGGPPPTLEPSVMWEAARRINPNVMVPIHFKTDRCTLPIAGLETFLAGKEHVQRANGPSATITRDTLPEPIRILVLDVSR
ncbi:MAG: MBL fold metallo-hydrolase [Chloroflexi bacterium]|nr:MBL fold metallo-hydrolase [Chloroflexota bacterium]